MNAAPPARAHRLADIEERGLVLLALADHDDAFDREVLELPVHGFGGCLVSCGLVAAAPPQRRGDGRGLGHTHDIERQSAVELGLRRSFRHVRSSLPQALMCGALRDTHSLSQFFDADHLRLLIDMAVALDRGKRLADRRLGGLMGDEHDKGGGVLVAPVEAGKLGARAALHDALD